MKTTPTAVLCAHCGDACPTERIVIEDKVFCCDGCKLVYQLLDRNGLCTYYTLNDRPGVNRRDTIRKDSFAFLDEAQMAAGLISFQDEKETHVTFYLPAIHCSSCLYLLENLRRLDAGVLYSRIDFAAKEISVVFDLGLITLRGVAELLTSLGYEPYISLRDLKRSGPAANKALIYRLGVAGFCFGNIMLLCFPEYLGLDRSEGLLRQGFRYLSGLLALPVLFYSAQPFFVSAWKGLRHRFLNIDAPIALAVLVTFLRSGWEVLAGQGSGYFDSMSGIVFFMLAGRVLQDRTYRRLSFDRDYTSYFPMAVTVLQDQEGREVSKALPDLRCGDTLLLHNGELIPADGILSRGRAYIDYSFVTGESAPVAKEVGEIVYAGGRQAGGAIEVLVVKEVAQSYLTQLWNREPGVVGEQAGGSAGPRFIDLLSRYFTLAVFVIAGAAAVYWGLYDPSRVWKAVTAVLIVACPCALLLSSTFTNGNLLRIMARQHFYLKNAETIERMAAVTHIVFDKTGTLTDTVHPEISYEGSPLSTTELQVIAALAGQSTHPLSRALAAHLRSSVGVVRVAQIKEWPGEGIEAFIGDETWRLGSAVFVGGSGLSGTAIYIGRGGRLLGAYRIRGQIRAGIDDLARRLSSRVRISVLSGDSAQERDRLQQVLGENVAFHFGQSPQDKTAYIGRLQRQGEKVMMVGDGLNDAGALQQSDMGVAVTADCSNFTPASQGILRADQLNRLAAFIAFCRSGGRIILASFGLSILYNVVGLFFAVHGSLSPLVAAVLMPASSLSILLITYGSSNVLGAVLFPKRNEENHVGE